MGDHREQPRPSEHPVAAKPSALEEPRPETIVTAEPMSMLEAAQAYRYLGWSILPLLPRSKRPLVQWTELQYSHAADDDLTDWWPKGGTNGVGIVCGSISGVVVVDIDGPDGESAISEYELPMTPTVITARGRHLYFRHPGFSVQNRVGILQKVDVRGDGGFVVAPPSVHESGAVYEWAPGLSPWEVPLAECPTWLITPEEKTPSQVPAIGTWQAKICIGVGEGARNSTVASLVGHLLGKGVDPHIAEAVVHAWARTSTHPPLDTDEVQAVIDSIAERELAQRRGWGL